MADKEEDTDTSQSDFDEVDGGNVLIKAKRKILKFFKPKKRVADHPEGHNLEGGGHSKQTATSMNPEEDVYNFSHRNRGICVIINNEDFYPGTGLGARPSSGQDVKKLRKAFTDLDFFVKVYMDLTGAGIDKKLRKVAQKYDHDSADCLVCIVLSHGGTGEIPDKKQRRVEKLEFVYGTDGSKISVPYMMSLFDDEGCPDLTGKPRLFLFQACRGIKTEKGVVVKVTSSRTSAPKQYRQKKPSDKPDDDSAQASDLKPEVTKATEGEEDKPDAKPEVTQETEGATGISGRASSSASTPQDEDEDYLDEEILVTSPTPCYMDSLVMFASPPGYFAFLRSNGSWLMTSLSSAIEDAKRSDPNKVDFLKVLTHTSYKMAFDFKSNNNKKPEIHNCKVVPCLMSSLTKAVFFEPKPSPPEVPVNLS